MSRLTRVQLQLELEGRDQLLEELRTAISDALGYDDDDDDDDGEDDDGEAEQAS